MMAIAPVQAELEVGGFHSQARERADHSIVNAEILNTVGTINAARPLIDLSKRRSVGLSDACRRWPGSPQAWTLYTNQLLESVLQLIEVFEKGVDAKTLRAPAALASRKELAVDSIDRVVSLPPKAAFGVKLKITSVTRGKLRVIAE
jgi:hypothetical protein